MRRSLLQAAAALALLGAACAAWADDASRFEARPSDDAVKSANKKVMEQIRAGNRDSQALMRILAPALKAREDEMRAEAEESRKRAREPERKDRPPAAQTQATQTPLAPIVDPSSVPREISFDRAPPIDDPEAGPKAPFSGGGGGVNEVSFEPPSRGRSPNP